MDSDAEVGYYCSRTYGGRRGGRHRPTGGARLGPPAASESGWAQGSTMPGPTAFCPGSDSAS
jgi:hypothetical protein